ncbi:hypothetical protein PG984_002516 [Apiospora sp. TS-2023a]
MVGVPRSNACALCLSRRVKCDETRPSCSNCVKYGAACPGYVRGAKFVAGKHVVKSRARGRGGGTAVAFAAVSSRTTSSSSSYSTTTPLAAAAAAAVSSSSFSPSRASSYGTRRPSSRRVPDAVSPPASRGIPPPRQAPVHDEDDAGDPLEWQDVDREQISGQQQQKRFLTSYEKLQSALAHPESEMVVLGTWFQQTASHLGQKPSLDRASCAFALQLLGRNHQDEGLLAQSRTLYGQSLWMLQQALNHPTEWKTPETLTSAMILCHFELFAGTATTDSWSTWMKHALGVGRLIQLRGPGSFNTEWERAILLSFRPIMIMNDLFSGQDCFLAHPRWQPVMRHHNGGDSTTPSDFTVSVGSTIYKDQEVDLVDDYMQLLARIPSAVKHLYMLRAANQGEGGGAAKAKAALGMEAEVARIRQSMVDIRDALGAWYQRILPFNPAPAEVSTQDPASIYASVLRYESPWKGALHMGYWASLCIVYATLMECRQASSPSPPNSDDDDDENCYGSGAASAFETLADRILRSVETVGEGMMGPYRCGYSIRIAYEVVDERTQAWIRMWVARFEKRYAATAVESYPSPRDVFLSPSSTIFNGGGEGGGNSGLIDG